MIASWHEGERFSGTRHPVLTVRHATVDAKRLAADIIRINGSADAVDALEWRRIVDTCFICGIKGYSNLHRNTLGDGEWKPMIQRGKRYKLGSSGGVIYA